MEADELVKHDSRKVESRSREKGMMGQRELISPQEIIFNKFTSSCRYARGAQKCMCVCGWGYLAPFWQEKFVNADKTLFDDVYKCKKM